MTGRARRLLGRVVVALVLGLGLLVVAPAAGGSTAVAIPGIDDCKEAPSPEAPGRGITGWFESPPETLPPVDDPFTTTGPAAEQTSVAQQYGYAGLRWNTYDLGCGPDVSRQPDAVVGTAVANWLFNVPKALAALTTAVTEAAFAPTFLQVFDPLVVNVSTTLHDRVFTAWVPLTIAALGVWILWKSRRASLATTTAAIGWALLVLAVTASLFRWPLEAGRFADQSVTATLGSVAGGLSDSGAGQTPADKAVANVHEALLYNAWLAGTFGSADSETAQTYGPQLFAAQALTWREAQLVAEGDADLRDRILEDKRDDYERVAAEVKAADPDAYDYLTGKRSETRVGYAVLATVAALCTLPFLLVSSLLVIAAFLIVRFAVMVFPAFAVLGLFPSARGLVLGVFRTVAAALVNAVIFGIAAAITVRAMGIILDPSSRLPGWLAIVLMLVFSIVMWVATKPFRRLTTMVGAGADPFGDAAGAVGTTSRRIGRGARRIGRTAVGTYVGGVGTAATVAAADHEDDDDRQPARAAHAEAHRAEAASPPPRPGAPAPAASPASRSPHDDLDRVPGAGAPGPGSLSRSSDGSATGAGAAGAAGGAGAVGAGMAEASGPAPQPTLARAPADRDDDWEAWDAELIYRPGDAVDADAR